MKKHKRYKQYIRTLRKRKQLEKHGSFTGMECRLCGGDIFYYDKYDATCCLRCDVWYNEKCNAPDCPHCSQRPDTPKEALANEQNEQIEPYDTLWRKKWRRDNYARKYSGWLRKQKKYYSKNFFEN